MANEREVTFPVGEGSAKGFLVVPDEARRSPAMLVLHEWFGVNDDIRGICRRFAAAGFAAMAVDLYGGRSTTDSAEAMQLSSELKTADAMKILEAARAFVTAQPGVGSKVGVTGFCLGGAITIAAACNVPGLSAAVPFYGTPKDDFIDFSVPRPPILGHYGQKDPIIRVERVRAIADAAVASGNRFDATFYDAGHAFMREADPAAYDAASADLAWKRTIAFLTETLSA